MILQPILRPVLRSVASKAKSIDLILQSLLTEEGQPILTEESGLIQTE